MKKMKKGMIYLPLLLILIVFLFPLLYTLYYSFLPLSFIDKLAGPKHFTLDNFKALFENYPIIRWFLNTLVNTGLIVAGNMIIDCMAGYALARLDFPGKNIIFIIVLASMMIPYQFVITPVYLQLAELGWLDKMTGITVPYLFNCLYVFMARQFFLTIPKELEDAARIDGLGRAAIFFRMIVPCSKSLMVSIVIFSFAGTWNSYLVPATFITTRERFTLAVGLKTVKDLSFENVSITLAGVVVLSLPILIVFVCLQKHFVEGIATTGIKG